MHVAANVDLTNLGILAECTNALKRHQALL